MTDRPYSSLKAKDLAAHICRSRRDLEVKRESPHDRGSWRMPSLNAAGLEGRAKIPSVRLPG